MKQIIALQNYSDQYVSLYEGQIRIIETNLANRLITLGVAAEHTDVIITPGSTSSGSTSSCNCEPGYQVTTTQTNLFTTVGFPVTEVPEEEYYMSSEQRLRAISEDFITEAPNLTITYDGTTYENIEPLGINIGQNSIAITYGDSGDFSEYPFSIIFEKPKDDDEPGIIYQITTSTSGTHNISVIKVVENITVTEDFKKSVQSIGSGLVVTIKENDQYYYLNKNYQEITSALHQGKNVVFLNTSGGDYYYLVNCTQSVSQCYVTLCHFVQSVGARFLEFSALSKLDVLLAQVIMV